MRQSFTWNPAELRVGRLSVNGSGHSYQRVDGTLSPPIDPADPAWTNRPAFGPVTLVASIGPFPAGAKAYVLNGEAFIRAADVVFVPDPDDVSAERDRVKAKAIELIGGIQ